MSNPASSRPSRSRWKLTLGLLACGLIAALVGLFAMVAMANRTGRTLSQWLQDYQSGKLSLTSTGASATPGEPLDWYTPRPVGDAFTEPPRISFVQVHDLDRDGRLDVLVCDCVENKVSWLHQNQEGQFIEKTILADVPAPARLECVDLDGDQDLDLVVAVLGKLFPSDEKVGALLVLENEGQQEFSTRTLLQGVARVSDVRSGDLDQDGDLDLVVTHFGYYDGQLQWLENQGDWQFEGHVLQQLPGGIHGIVADLNNDQTLDIAVLISQEFERIDVFYGDGKGNFEESNIYQADNPDFGSSGISLADLDADGDLDILYTNGDAFDYSPPRPWPWHGVQWLENRGQSDFRYHRLADFGGAVNAKAVDVDRDGDIDILAASAFNAWDDPESQSLILLENAGSMNFVIHGLGNAPSHIQALDVADLSGDNQWEIVTGGMHIFEPYDRVERLAIWSRDSTQNNPPVESTAIKDSQ